MVEPAPMRILAWPIKRTAAIRWAENSGVFNVFARREKLSEVFRPFAMTFSGASSHLTPVSFTKRKEMV